MTPTCCIVAEGADITALINDRLLLLRTTDKPGMESDDFELRIDGHDSAVSLPSRGASIEVFLGYSGTALTRLGRYTVDEVELSSPPPLYAGDPGQGQRYARQRQNYPQRQLGKRQPGQHCQ